MVKTTKTVTVDTNNGNNAPVYDYAIEIRGIVQDWKESAKLKSKAEGHDGHAGFRLARILANDLLPQTTAYSILRKHTPESFFTSEEVRRVWKAPEVLTTFVDEKANEDPELKGKVRTNWNRTVELAFAIWACQRHFAKVPDGPQVDMTTCLVPAAAYIAAHDRWNDLFDNEHGKKMLVPFARKEAQAGGRKGAEIFSAKFIPSVSGFMDNRAAWLEAREVRAKRDRAGSKSNAKADPHGVPAMGTVTATAAPELLTKAFTNLATDGKHTVLPAMAKDEKGKEGIGNMLYAILTNMAVNDVDFLRGVIVDAVHDDNAGNALRAMLATILNDAAKAETVDAAEAITA